VPLFHHDQAQADLFLSEIEPMQAAYCFPNFRFIALQCKNEWIVFHGILSLDTAPALSVPPFQTRTIFAGEVRLADVANSAQDFIRRITSSGITIGDRRFTFPAEQSGNHRAHCRSFDGAINPLERAGSLVIVGSSNHYPFAQDQAITRELKTAATAFNSIAELASHYRMNFQPSMNLHVEVWAPAVCEITEDSCVKLDSGCVAVRLASELQNDKVRVSLRGLQRDGSVVRLPDLILNWRRSADGEWISSTTFPFAQGKKLTCTLIYDGLVQQECTVGEPVALRNTMRFALNVFGDAESAFTKVIDDPKATNRDGREFEATANAIFSLAGFKTAAVDRIPGLQEMPDIIASDPSGNLLIVECTLNLPKAADKLAILFNRAEAIRSALDDAGLTHVKVVSLLATLIPQEKLNPYLKDAREAGVLLWGREQMHALQQRANTQTANEIFDSLATEHELLKLLNSYSADDP